MVSYNICIGRRYLCEAYSLKKKIRFVAIVTAMKLERRRTESPFHDFCSH